MKYRIDEGPVGIGPGFVLALTTEQVVHRVHRLRPRQDGAYDVLEPLQFKAGEVIDVLSGDLGKAMLAKVTALQGKARAKD